MENSVEFNQKSLINELKQGRDTATQLQTILPLASLEQRELQKIVSSFTNALSMLKWTDSDGEPQPTGPGTVTGTDSPRSVSGSPGSENSDPSFKDQERREIYKKRKSLPKWSEQVHISSPTTALDGPLEDGYSWRKYGQKDILGAKYPRGYYRCTHRHVQGCIATKQVQRSDENPLIFDITYRGKHTCLQVSPRPPPSAEKLGHQNYQDQQVQQQQQSQILLNFRTGLTVKTEGLESEELNSSPFSFPSSSSMGCIKSENHMFLSSALENNFMGSFSPQFISPATSESNYFSVSPSRMSSYGGGGANVRTSESDLTEIISAVTSASNSPLVNLDFHLDPVDFDPNFPFDASSFFN